MVTFMPRACSRRDQRGRQADAEHVNQKAVDAHDDRCRPGPERRVRQWNDDEVHHGIDGQAVQEPVDNSPPVERGDDAGRHEVGRGHAKRDEEVEQQAQERCRHPALIGGTSQHARRDALQDADRFCAAQTEEDKRVENVERADDERASDQGAGDRQGFRHALVLPLLRPHAIGHRH